MLVEVEFPNVNPFDEISYFLSVEEFEVEPKVILVICHLYYLCVVCESEMLTV